MRNLMKGRRGWDKQIINITVHLDGAEGLNDVLKKHKRKVTEYTCTHMHHITIKYLRYKYFFFVSGVRVRFKQMYRGR